MISWSQRLIIAGVFALVFGQSPAHAQIIDTADLDPSTPPQEVWTGQGHRIYVITWRGCEESCEGFLEYFEANDIPAQFIIRNAEQNPDLLPGFRDEARALDPDLILTWGSTVTLAVIGPWDVKDSQYITDKPVVFMYVAQMVESKITRSLETTGRPNVAGTDYSVPLESQLRAIQAYRPFDRLAIIFDPAQEGSVRRVEAVRQFTESLDFTLIAEALPLGDDGRPDPAKLPEVVERVAAQRPQFIYFGYNSFLIRNVEEFTRLAVEHGLPIFTGGPLPLVKGQALLGLFNRLRSVGRLAAYQAEQILVHGTSPEELPIARFNRYSMAINMKVARQLELYPPMLLLSYAEIIE